MFGQLLFFDFVSECFECPTLFKIVSGCFEVGLDRFCLFQIVFNCFGTLWLFSNSVGVLYAVSKFFLSCAWLFQLVFGCLRMFDSFWLFPSCLCLFKLCYILVSVFSYCKVVSGCCSGCFGCFHGVS